MAFLTLAVLASAAAEPTVFDPKVLQSTQLRGLGSDPFGEPERENRWLKDISTSTKNYFKKVLAPLQTPIVQEFQVLTILESYVNYTMDKVENATGYAVIWNRTHRMLMEETEETFDASGRSLYGRRRRPIGEKNLPPRARYINKILMYLNKEMDLLWNYNTIIDRKRWGVGNTITSSPYGPHGEHPERWRANGSFPVPIAPNHTILLQESADVQQTKIKLRVKADEKKFTNKYALQLQADYYSLVDNINDASEKISDLRNRLWKMNDFADQFIVLPSGVWNKIDAQV